MPNVLSEPETENFQGWSGTRGKSSAAASGIARSLSQGAGGVKVRLRAPGGGEFRPTARTVVGSDKVLGRTHVAQDLGRPGLSTPQLEANSIWTPFLHFLLMGWRRISGVMMGRSNRI